MNKEDRKIISNLRKNKEYDKIYKLYGQKKYIKVVSPQYQNADIDKLMKEGRYLDIYEKYGEAVYKKYLNAMQKVDVEMEVGLRPGFINYLFFEKCKQKLRVTRNVICGVAVATAIIPSIFFTGMMFENTMNAKINQKYHSKELEEYNNEIKEYANYINSLNLSDLEIIMKVMNDMWNNIDGYKDSDNYDYVGCYRLGLFYDGYGMCRNMADDFTARMNAINPEYEACNIDANLTGVELNNIKLKLAGLDGASGVAIDDNPDNKIGGNHLVSCLKIKEKDLILVVDPTNPSIGVLKDGKIYMLSSSVQDGLELSPLGNYINGAGEFADFVDKYLDSYDTDINLDKLINEYGVKAQNEVLDDIIEKYDEEHYHVK